MSMLDKMLGIETIEAQPKPRYVLVDGEWELKQPEVEHKETWETCGAPVVGKPCPKCKGTTALVHHDGRVGTCHWCTDGSGVISRNDKRNFDRRVMKGLPMCFIVTAA